MQQNLISGLPDGLHNSISSPIKTMKPKKRSRNMTSKPVIDLENLFLRLLLIGQRRDLRLEALFNYEMCGVPPSLIDEYGCLRKSNKSKLVQRLGTVDMTPQPSNIVVSHCVAA